MQPLNCSYIYDKSGAEIHQLRSHIEPTRLEFLPYHFLLASVGRTGWLKYQDTSTGALVAEHRTRLGPCSVMTQNPRNAVLALGHANGRTAVPASCWDAAFTPLTPLTSLTHSVSLNCFDSLCPGKTSFVHHRACVFACGDMCCSRLCHHVDPQHEPCSGENAKPSSAAH